MKKVSDVQKELKALGCNEKVARDLLVACGVLKDDEPSIKLIDQFGRLFEEGDCFVASEPMLSGDRSFIDGVSKITKLDGTTMRFNHVHLSGESDVYRIEEVLKWKLLYLSSMDKVRTL